MDLAQQMQQLYQRFGEIEGITIELHKELLAIRVENTRASAVIFLQGAQLSHYQRRGEQPLIWNSPLCDYQAGKPLRGGIPVCWPWFGDLSRNAQAVQNQIHVKDPGAHGFARNSHWQLDEIVRESAAHTRLSLSLPVAADDHPAWPYASQLNLQFDIGEQLTLNFRVQNQSAQTFSYSAALHSYFAVSDIARVTINGLEQLDYVDCMDDWQTRQQQAALVIDQETDRIYQGTGTEHSGQPIAIIDQQWQRTLTINSRGSNSTVLWNPWIDKAKRLSHFADDAYKTMLCIETANAAEDFVTLAPGQTHQLSVTLGSNALN